MNEQSLTDRIADHFDPQVKSNVEPAAETVEEVEASTEQVQADEEQQATDVEVEQASGEDSTEAEETVSETSDETQPYAEVTFEGKAYNVPLELKEALIHGADYTRKTQDVARQHEAADMRADALRQEQENLQFENSLLEERKTISLIDSQIAQYKELDWTSLSMEQQLQHKMNFDNLKEQKVEVEQSITGKRQQFGEQRNKNISEHMGKSSAWLKKSIPGWNQDQANKVAQFAQTVGYTEQEVNSIIDPRAVQTLYEQMRYRELVKGTGKVMKAANNAPPVVKPGAAPKAMPPEVRDKLNYRKSMAKAKKDGLSEQQRAALVTQRMGDKMSRL